MWILGLKGIKVTYPTRKCTCLGLQDGTSFEPLEKHRKRLCSISYKYDIYWPVSGWGSERTHLSSKEIYEIRNNIFFFAVFSECPLKTVPILGILSNALTGKVSNVYDLVIFQENAEKKSWQ